MPARLHLRSDLHLARKTWHLMMGLLIAFIYLSGVDRMSAVLMLGSALGVDVLLETARLKIPALNEKVLRWWGPLMRSCEAQRMSGAPHYILSTLLAIAIFPKPVAILSILYLACGDPIASLFGILYGKHSLKITQGKSLVGTAAGVVTCMLLTFIFLKTQAIADDTALAVSLLGGLAGGTAELVPTDLDDNFTIPVISGFVLWLIFIVFGI